MAKEQRTTTFDRRAALALITDWWETQRRVAKSHSAVNFHEGGYPPNGDWKMGLASTLTESAFTPTSSPHTVDSGFSNFSAWDGTDTLERDVSTGYLTIKREVNPCIITGCFDVSIPTVQNNWSLVIVRLQMQNPDTLAWGNVGLPAQRKTMWPNVAVLSGGTDHFDRYMLNTHYGIVMNEDWKIRARAEVYYSGALADVTVECVGLYFYYQ